MNRSRKRITGMVLFGVLLLAMTIIGFGQSSKRPALIFTGIANPDNCDNPSLGYRAVIFVFDRGAWRLINLPKDQYENASWEYAGRSKSKPEVWAVAQFGRGDIGPNLEIAHSLDDGRTWTHFSLNKISRFAGFESLSMTAGGRASLTIHLQESPEPEHRDGYYTYTSTNGGRSWSTTPRYSPTAPPAPADNLLEPISVQTSGIQCSESESENPSLN